MAPDIDMTGESKMPQDTIRLLGWIVLACMALSVVGLTGGAANESTPATPAVAAQTTVSVAME
jgi:hypothetical protein